MTAHNAEQAPGGAGTVAFIAFSTESPHASRGDVHLADLARTLRRQGYPSRVFHVHLDPRDEEENRARVSRLVERLIEERCRWAVFEELWTPEFGRQLQAAGIGIIETRSHTFEGAILSPDVFSGRSNLLTHVSDCATGQPLEEYENLVEIVGPKKVRPITSIDLRIEHSCGYKQTLAENPFYRDVLSAPDVATHRGCAYCLSARTESGRTPTEIAEQIIQRIRHDRKVFPALEVFWMAFAETYYESLGIAFRTTRDDPAWRGITLSMQCRPDVIAQRESEIEALGAEAATCGTRLRIGVVGFENFSPREILILNRGAAPEFLDTAASILHKWSINTPPGLVVRGFTPSFILFTPWTRVADLEINLQRIAKHGLWSANIERLRIGPGTPAFVRAQHDGLIVDGPVRAAAHPNGYSSEREFAFADPAVAAICAGFEKLRPYAFKEQPELLAGVVASVVAAGDPADVDWADVSRAWEELDAAARG